MRNLPRHRQSVSYAKLEAEKLVSDQPLLTLVADAPSLNDQRQQITKMILSQSEEEKSAMNDFTLVVPPTRKVKLNELNGEKRLKIKISE